MPHYKYLIIGQGLAGTCLSVQMHLKGVSHLIVDEPTLSKSSKVAAGLVNPIVLKRLKWVKDAELFMPTMLNFYENLESLLNVTLLKDANLHHIFNDNAQINHWCEQSSKHPFSAYLDKISSENLENLKAPFGLGKLKNIYWLDTNNLMDAWRSFSLKQDILIHSKVSNFSINALRSKYRFDKAIICTGHLSKNQYPILQHAFSLTRGEVLEIETSGFAIKNQAYHKGVFMLPLGNNRYKVGATYAWDNLQDQITTEGRSKLQSELDKFLKAPYKVLKHEAGVRPNTKDRKALLGEIEEDLYLFNGLGSRGALMAPYLSNILLEHLEHGKVIPLQWNVKRFI